MKLKLFKLSPTKLANNSLLILVCLASGFGGGWLGARTYKINSNQSINREVLTSEGEVIKDIAKQVGPSVVSINVTSKSSRINFYGVEQAFEQQSAGTGVVVSDDGYILTNRHVVGNARSIVNVTLSDGTQFNNVEIIGKTSENDSLDIAFLKINDLKGKKLKAASLGNSSIMEVGQKVVAIGNALGQFQNTVTSGIISGFGRNLIAGDETRQENLVNLFQTDAAINQGNSGGPLVNASGEVIGINTAVASGGAENIGFAIPIDDIKGMVATLLETGKFERPYLGVRYIDITDEYAAANKLPVKRGAYLAPADGEDTVLLGSPAAKAGLQEKDIITKINDFELNEKNNLTSLIGRSKVGQKVSITFIRNGKEMIIEATLEASPHS